MSPARQRLRILVDRVIAALLAAIVAGATLGFGGMAWWARPALAAATTALVLAAILRMALAGRAHVLRSPLTALGVLALGLAAAQLAPLPGRLAARLSPRSRQAYAAGALAALARADDPGAETSGPIPGRSPASLDRPATLRWLLGASACLAVFCVAAGFADRLRHAMVIWGGAAAAFGLATVLGLVGLAGGSDALYGLYVPGRAPAWAPSLADLRDAPGATVLRPLDSSGGFAAARPVPVATVGGMPGGPGAYLALAALGLPLSLGLALQRLAPRGSREGVWTRTRLQGQGGLIVLLYAAAILGAGLVGWLAGPWLAAPFALALALAGLPAAFGSGLRWSAPALTLGALLALGAGVLLGERLGRPEGAGLGPGLPDREAAAQAWADTARMARDFPVLGVGLGGFRAAYPYYKSQDASLTAPPSGLLGWCAEAGAAGLGLVALAALWCLARLPGALRRVGTADRPLAFALLGTMAGFAGFAALHWAAAVPAVALAASALAGTCNRWLAGGTDLFVEPA